MKKIVKKLHPYDWISVRNSNGNLRSFIDTLKLDLDIDIFIEGHRYTIVLNGKSFRYRYRFVPYDEISNARNEPFHPVVADDERRTIYNKGLQFALRKLFNVMKLPKAQIEKFSLDFDSIGGYEDYVHNERLRSSLRTIDMEFGDAHCFRAKSVSLSGFKKPRAALILSSFDAGTLVKFEIMRCIFNDIRPLTCLEQFKNAKQLRTDLNICSVFGFTVSDLLGFSSIEFTSPEVSPNDLKELVNSSTKLETCVVSKQLDDSESIAEEMLQEFDPTFAGKTGTINYKANGFEYVIEVTEERVKIEKKLG